MPGPDSLDAAQDRAGVADSNDEAQGSLQRFRDEVWTANDTAKKAVSLPRKGALDWERLWNERPDPCAGPDITHNKNLNQECVAGQLNFSTESSRLENTEPPVAGGLASDLGGEANAVSGSTITADKQLRQQVAAGSFRATDVDQGSIGDCFFMAALTSLANSESGRQTIKDMITINSDGTYTVRFKGDKDHAVIITEQDIKRVGPTNGAKWADVVETAFMKYTADGPFRDILKQSGIGLFARVRNTRDAINLLTSQDVSTDQFSLTALGSQQFTLGETSRANVKRDLEWAMKHQSVVTAGVNPAFARFIGGNDPGPVPDQHVYAVLAFDSQTDTVTLRNPWGHNANSPLSKEGATVDGITNIGEGKLQMSLDTFMKRYSDVNISGRNETLASVEHVTSDASRAASNLVDAGEDLLSGKPERALGNLSRAVTNAHDVQNEMLYGATNLIWMRAKAIAANPVEIIAPGSGKVVAVLKKLI